MSENNFLEVTDESPSVQSHLSMLQNIIQRMVANSSSCKSLCITLVSAVLVIVADKVKPDYTWIALLPTIIFSCLDAYYLLLEKGFRNAYNEFVKKSHTKELQQSDLYAINPSDKSDKVLINQISALRSVSVWGVYSISSFDLH